MTPTGTHGRHSWHLQATNDGGLGICIWEGESIDAVREVVEGAVGPWAANEYYEMRVDGLTPQLRGIWS